MKANELREVYHQGLTKRRLNNQKDLLDRLGAGKTIDNALLQVAELGLVSLWFLLPDDINTKENRASIRSFAAERNIRVEISGNHVVLYFGEIGWFGMWKQYEPDETVKLDLEWN